MEEVNSVWRSAPRNSVRIYETQKYYTIQEQTIQPQQQ